MGDEFSEPPDPFNDDEHPESRLTPAERVDALLEQLPSGWQVREEGNTVRFSWQFGRQVDSEEESLTAAVGLLYEYAGYKKFLMAGMEPSGDREGAEFIIDVEISDAARCVRSVRDTTPYLERLSEREEE